MEGHGHDPVSGVEGLLHTVSMVDVYVDVQHSLVVPGTEQGGCVCVKGLKVRNKTQLSLPPPDNKTP